MDSTIVVGVVGVVATAVTAWIGSWNTRRATERTVEAGTDANRATLVAAREDRFWERQAAAYEETLAGLLYRRSERSNILIGLTWDEAFKQQLEEAFGSRETPRWFEAQGRLTAYASDAVMDAFWASARAHGEMRTNYVHAETTREQIRMVQASGTPLHPSAGENMTKANQGLNNAIETVKSADDTLIDLIRVGLRSRPEAATPPPTGVPAVHRGFLRRR